MPIPIKTIDMVENIFMQGDMRYIDPEDAETVAAFLHYDAIEMEKAYIYDIETTDEEEKGICGPQKNYKALTKRVLKERNCKIIGYERRFPGGITDVLAKDSKGNNVIVECCSYRINKAIQYLEEENTILWILSQTDEDKVPVTRLPLFIFKRGPNWEKAHKIYSEEKLKILKQQETPLDRLYENKNDKTN